MPVLKIVEMLPTASPAVLPTKLFELETTPDNPPAVKRPKVTAPFALAVLPPSPHRGDLTKKLRLAEL